MSTHVRSTLGGLARDLGRVPVIEAREGVKLVRSNAIEGNRRALRYAKESSGKHGRHYATSKVFKVEQGADVFTWIYGPDASVIVVGKTGTFQPGGMATGFEKGSRNQKPHRNLDRSADGIGFKMQYEVREMFDKLFWP